MNSPDIRQRAVRLGIMGGMVLALVAGVSGQASAQNGDSLGGGGPRGNSPKPTTTTSTPAPTTTVPPSTCPQGECTVTVEGVSSIVESDTATYEYRVRLSKALPQPITVCVKTEDVSAGRADGDAAGQAMVLLPNSPSPATRDFTVYVGGSAVPRTACANLTIPAGATQSTQTITVRAWFETMQRGAGWDGTATNQFLAPNEEQRAIRGMLLLVEWFEGVREGDESFNLIVESTTGGPCVVAGPALRVTITDPTEIPPPPPPPPLGPECLLPENWAKIGDRAVECELANGLPADPLAIDLNGDGVRTTPVSPSAGRFSITGLGDVRIGWLSTGDGWIVSDDNGNGTIDGLDEMLGDLHRDGFAELAGFDGNGDGNVDGDDARYADLSIWVDANDNRRADAGEMRSLADAGVSSLSLAVVNRQEFQDGNQVNRHSAATIDGREVHLADVMLEFLPLG